MTPACPARKRHTGLCRSEDQKNVISFEKTIKNENFGKKKFGLLVIYSTDNFIYLLYCALLF